MKISGSLRVLAGFPAAVLRLRGEDAPGFLQGQFSYDLRGLASGEVRYGLWLTVKGKVLADSYVMRTQDGGFLVISLTSPAETIRRRLEDFIIADDVTVEEETDRWASATIVGEGAAALSLPEDPTIHRLPYPGRPDRSDWLFPRGALPKALAALPPIDEAAFKRLRIEAGMIEIPRDLGPGELPHEGRLESLAISYDKGCYLGQEIMARLKTHGKVRRRLVRITGRGPTPPSIAPIFSDTKVVGELRSAEWTGAGFVGLALLPATVTVGQEFTLGSSGTTVSVCE